VVCDRLAAWGLTPHDLRPATVAAIGLATARALVRHGVTPDLVPEQFVAEAVVQAIALRGELRGKRVLLPRAREARDALPEGLRALGAVVDAIPVYETVREAGDRSELAGEMLAGKIAAITFTSSSTVRHFVEIVGREAATCGRFATAVIGPVTAATARELGLTVAVHSLKDLPTHLPDGLALGAVPERGDPAEALVTRADGVTGIPALARGAKVGTSSLRRVAQLRYLRPDLEIVALRGNVPTRVQKVREGRD